MADFDLKSITPAASVSSDTEMLFGSVDQSTGTPKPYTFAGIWAWILGKFTTDTDNARSGLVVGFGSASKRFYTYNDCLYVNGGSEHWSTQTSGTGAAIGTIVLGSLNAIGIFTLGTGTTTTGRAAMYSSTNSAATNVELGKGRARFQAKAAVHTLSNGTDTYSTRIGFIDNLAGEPTDGVFFRYTDSVNSGKWQAVTRSNGTETATDTGIAAVADTWHLMTIDVNAAGSSVVFSIDGSTVATTATNIPTGAGRETGYGIAVLKSVGTTDTSGCYVDFAEVEYVFTTPR